jgi:fumarylacetoacetase
MQPAIVDIPAGSDFPLENLPYGAVVRAPPDGSAANPRPRLAVALGDSAVDLAALAEHGLLCTGPILSRHPEVFNQPTLNAFLDLGPQAWAEARLCLSRLLSAREGALRDAPKSVRDAVLFTRPDATNALAASGAPPSPSCSHALPFAIGDYTDFYASRHHATNVGAMFRGKGNELQPNWLHLPVGYHGRASSVVVSGEPVRRPWGQVILPPGAAAAAAPATTAPTPAPETPTFRPSHAVDYELEVAAVVGQGTPLGGPGISARDALPQGSIFGLVLMNDWSARDVQRWEGVPLGPFAAKNWATQVSPWVVTCEALEPYRADLPEQVDPRPLPYLTDEGAPAEDEEEDGGRRAAAEAAAAPCVRPGALASYDLSLRAELLPRGASRPTRLCDTNLRHLYWSFPQMAAHHTAGGCNLRGGDLLGSGTVSGPGPQQRACLLESTGNGARPFDVVDAGLEGMRRERRYLEDGDEVVISGWCGGGGGGEGGGGGGAGLPRIGFGECRGRLLPALRRRGGRV